MNGLKAAQFGLFLILLGFTVSLFSNVLFFLSAGVVFIDPAEYVEFAGKMLAWGLLSLPISWGMSWLGKLLCAGVPEQKAQTLIIASLASDLAIFGCVYMMTQSLGGLLVGLIGILISALLSYILFLKFLGRMGDNVGEPRVSQYTAILLGLIVTSFVVGFSSIFSRTAGVLGVNLLGFFTTCLFNYTIFVLYRALPLYIEEVKMGITDATESAEERKEKERKERLHGPAGGAGPSQGKEPEEPKGEPPEGHKLYRIPKKLEPLHMAVKEGDRHKVDLRLSHRDDPNKPVRHGLTPLHIAASVGVMDVADALIKAGAPVDATCEMGLTPLFFAVQTGNHNMVGFLVNKGASLFHQNDRGYTALHWACCAPHPNYIGPVRVKMVTLLISQGADIQAQTKDGKTARDLAVENQLEETTMLLDRHLGRGGPSLPLKSVSHVSEDTGPAEPDAFPPFLGLELSVLPRCLEPLHEAVKDGDPEKTQVQLAAGAKIDDALEGGIKPIHITAITGVMAVTEMLLRYGAKIDDTYQHNLTSVFLAVHLNNLAMVGYLVSKGANINHQDDMGRTPLHWGAAAPHEKLVGGNRVKMVQFLLEQGADPKIKDKNGQTAEDLARAVELDDVLMVFDDLKPTEDSDDGGDEDAYYV
jgi:ankyrin repeat protein